MTRNKTKVLSSDHYFHIVFVNAIKARNHKFLIANPVLYNEKNFCYPHFFHWLLSFLPQRVIVNYKWVNTIVFLLNLSVFNAFLILLSESVFPEIKTLDIIFSNLVFITTPFSYSTWNAKNNGLSARGFGVFVGHMFVYSLSCYLYIGGAFWAVVLVVTFYLVVISSQMAWQFCLFTCLIVGLVRLDGFLLLVPLISSALFLVTFPQFSRSFFRGQFNHKRNYALYMAGVFILRMRPSIYMDFVVDFWVKFREDKKKGLLYIFYNPLVEIMYGFPAFWLILLVVGFNGLNPKLEYLLLLPLTGLGIFFLTSFRKTRFLGEPQRYLEFLIPIISILSVMLMGEVMLMVCVLSVVFVFLTNYLINKTRNLRSQNEQDDLLKFISINYKGSNEVVISNDPNLLKSLPQFGLKVVKPDVTQYYKSASDFFFFYPEDFNVLSFEAVFKYLHEFKPRIFIWNRKLSSGNVGSLDDYKLNRFECQKVGKYEVYDLNQSAND